jgi:hypothetical protein
MTPPGLATFIRRTTWGASILPFEGWTEADTKRLEKFLQNVVGDEAEP